jgi:hypothetical protein
MIADSFEHNTYTKSFNQLETQCVLIGSGDNKRVYYNNKNNIVFKLFKNKNLLFGELSRYSILSDKNMHFFIPKTKYINEFVLISQFANPIRIIENYSKVVFYPEDYNQDVMDSKIKLLNNNPIVNNNWDIICNRAIGKDGKTPLYNWGIRKNKILLLDFEMINIERTISYLSEQDNRNEFKESLNINNYTS